MPSAAKAPGVAALGAGPCPLITNVPPRRASKPMIGTSPPGPDRCGSTTCRTSPEATAASNALPPFSSTAIPAAEASQWVEATMPNEPASSGRVVNSLAAGMHTLRVRWRYFLFHHRHLDDRSPPSLPATLAERRAQPRGVPGRLNG